MSIILRLCKKLSRALPYLSLNASKLRSLQLLNRLDKRFMRPLPVYKMPVWRCSCSMSRRAEAVTKVRDKI